MKRNSTSAMDRESGFALIVALFILLALSALGMGVLLLTNTESKISDNLRSQTDALYVAQSGMELIVHYLNNPSDFTDVHGTYNGYSVSSVADAQRFFKKRRMRAEMPSYFNTHGLSQFDDTDDDGTSDGHDSTNPVLRYSRDATVEQRDFLDSITPDASEHSHIRELLIFAAPGGSGGVVTVRVVAKAKNSERTLELVIMPMGGVAFTDGLVSGADALWNGNSVLVHWGSVKIQHTPADIGNNLAKIPVRTVDADISNMDYLGTGGEDLWLRVLTSTEYVGPSSPASIFESSYENPPVANGSQNAIQYRSPHNNLFANQAVTIQHWDYLWAKRLASRFGTYYTTDASGNLYLRGGGPPLDFKTVTNARNCGYVFVDTIDRREPNATGTNLATISFQGNYYTEGLFYIAANFATAGLGNGATRTALSPPVLMGMKGTIIAGNDNALNFTVTSGDTLSMKVGDLILIGSVVGGGPSTVEELRIRSIDSSNSLTVASTVDLVPNAPGTSPAWYNHFDEDFIISTTQDETTRVTVNNLKFNFAGGLYCAGWVDMQGGPRYFGAVVAERGFASGGVPQIWYDWDLSRGDLTKYGIPNAYRGAWQEIY